ncbi:hypothetical protein ACFWN1_23430 [Streptomyces sp. NPDC058459]|uniref:hypothetical protein n=1 Tax=Streptomyces sp. NPDC058459 TaxID=3346508 RepID=UPI0036546E97
MPGGHSADRAGYTAAPVDSPYAVTGRRFAAGDGGGAALILGAEGVSPTGRTANGSDRAVTVRYRACAAV